MASTTTAAQPPASDELTNRSDPLPSWNDTATRKAILALVDRVTKQGSLDFVPKGERIAIFDNDGTLWAEQPMYFQLLFALERVKALAPQHPEWRETEPFASLLKGDVKSALGVSSRTLLAHSYRVIRRMRYGTDSTRERHNDSGGPSSDTT
jgi:hypothetical protein